MRRYLLLTVFVALLGCSSEIPDEKPGGRIRGSLRYAGNAMSTMAMARPSLRVLAALDFPPPQQIIYGLLILELSRDVDLAVGLPYELRNLAPASYKIGAQLYDQAASGTDPALLPLGGYPSFCGLTTADGFVAVSDEAPRDNINIEIFDHSGLDDPCNTSTSACTEPGFAGVRVTVHCSTLPGPTDRLIVSLADNLSSTVQPWKRLVPGSSIVFPYSVADGQVPPKSYLALYACLDIGGNATGMCDLNEDRMTFSLLTPNLSLPAGAIARFDVDLDAGTVVLQAVDSSCP